ARPKHRVVHLHVVDHGGAQWHRYLTFRDLLRTNADARECYERIKRDLAEKFPGDRKAYQSAKEGLVQGLLEQHAAGCREQ
ncbi:MAG: GrpB family protein, partial [Actinomycetota bacterium]|nr:GrpB family protein [Actinomycetota bacterium]